LDAEFEECCWLIKNGVHFDTAFEMDGIVRSAMAIKFAQFEGGKFNVETMRFEKSEGEHSLS
jgi:hypothetical protein